MPSRSRSRRDRWRLGIDPAGSVGLPPLDMVKRDNFVGLPLLATIGLPLADCCESSELVEVAVKLFLEPIFNIERCFDEQSRDGEAIFF